MTYICPHCRCEVVDGEKCSRCGVLFRAKDWRETAVTPGDRVRLEDGSFSFPAPQNALLGKSPRPYTEELSFERDRISVGGKKQHVFIADVAAPLAEFYRHLIPNGDEWWVVRCQAAAKIILNGKKEVDNCRLSEGDIVTVAGVPFLFTGRSLRIGQFEQPEICIETRDLSVFKNGKTILQDINFKIEPGEFIGILGPSGCGKSSLIQQLVGLGRATSGTIFVNGMPYSESADAMRKLTAYMPQTVALHNELTLEEEVTCFSLLHGNLPQEAEAKLALVGMRQETANRIGALSGGQQRRVGIALELLREPRLLILDEPTAGLDPASETQVMTYLRRLADQGRSVLCATHIMENLDKFDKVLVLSRGYGVFFGTPAELLTRFRISRPQELYDLLGAGSETLQRERAEKLAREFRDFRKNDSAGESEKRCNPLTECGRGASLTNQYLGYLRRQVMEFFSFRHTHPLRSFWTSACFIQLLLQPILIALVLRLACAQFFYQNSSANRFDLCYLCCLVVFWLGLNDAIRELVRERIPWRCLERLEKISMTGYIGAKLSWTALLALAKTLIFYLLVYVMQPASLIAADAGDPIVKSGLPGFLMLYGVCIVGAWVGLAISAVFTSEKAAIAMLPIVVVPILFFSATIIKFNENNNVDYNKSAACIAKWMPCYEPAEYLNRYSQSVNADPWIPIKNGGGTVLISLMILAASQFVLEKKWEGR